jgi:hypothetical protein
MVMKLLFNAAGKLQTAIECPTCGKTGKETMFMGCCSEYMLGLLGILSTQKGRDYNAETFLRGEDGYCYAYENCNEESCTHYLPYRREFSNGCNSECQHHRLNGQCTA